jgi:hypothetical protein
MQYTGAHVGHRRGGGYLVIGKRGQVDGNNFKSQMTGFAALGLSGCFTSQWPELSTDVVSVLIMTLVSSKLQNIMLV